MLIGAVFTLCKFGPEILTQYYFWSMQHCQCAIFIWNSLTGKGPPMYGQVYRQGHDALWAPAVLSLFTLISPFFADLP